jgi:hypothetical protein
MDSRAHSLLPHRLPESDLLPCPCLILPLKTLFCRWRTRRQSVKELKNRREEAYQEHLKLREIEERNWRLVNGELPGYEELAPATKDEERLGAGVRDRAVEIRNQEGEARSGDAR